MKQPRDLSKLPNFQNIYKGAERYGYSESDEMIDKSDRWFTLFIQNQKEKQLSPIQFKEFMELSNELSWEDLGEDEYSEGGLIAPNGKPSNLTPEQYKLVRTPEFKEWFGDWENNPEGASKIVDENGEPLVVLHGSKGFHDGKNSDIEGEITQFSSERLIFTTTNIDVAKYFGDYKYYFINIKNPFILNDNSHSWDRLNENELIEKLGEFDFIKFVNEYFNEEFSDIDEYWQSEEDYEPLMIDIDSFGEYLKKNFNYDGIIAYGIEETPAHIEADDYISFEPTQIKLADGSNTTFDSENPDIRFYNGGELESNKCELPPINISQINTPEFKNWWNYNEDFEQDLPEASDVKYRGQSENIGYVFKYGEKLLPKAKQENEGQYFGHYFVDESDKHIAKYYAYCDYEDKGHLMAVWLRIHFPIEILTQRTITGKQFRSILNDYDVDIPEEIPNDETKRYTFRYLEDYNPIELRKNIQNAGYDGFIFYDFNTQMGDFYSYVVFDANQIKSATENNGDFSVENNDIRFKNGGSIVPNREESLNKIGEFWNWFDENGWKELVNQEDIEKLNLESIDIYGNNTGIYYESPDGEILFVFSQSARMTTDKYGVVQKTILRYDKHPVLVLDYLVVKNKGLGTGSKSIKLLTELSDKYGIEIELQPKPIKTVGEFLSTEELARFYKKAGFEIIYDGGSTNKIMKYTPKKFDGGGNVPDYFWGNQAGGVLIISSRTNKVLLLKRSPYVQEPETWGMISGKIDEGETVEEAVAREVKEETGWKIDNLIPSFVFEKNDFTFYNFISVVDIEFTPKLDWENTDYGWFDLSNLPENLHFGVDILLLKDKYLKGLRYADVEKRMFDLKEQGLNINDKEYKSLVNIRAELEQNRNKYFKEGGYVKSKKVYVSIKLEYEFEKPKQISTHRYYKNFNGKAFKELKNHKLLGVIGVSESRENIADWFIYRECLIVMNYDEFIQLNNVTEIEYDNPEQLMKNDLELFNRLYGNKRTDNQTDFETNSQRRSNLSKIIEKLPFEFKIAGKTEKDNNLKNELNRIEYFVNPYETGAFVNWLEKNKFVINSPKEFAELIIKYHYSDESKSAISTFYGNNDNLKITADDIYPIVYKGLIKAGSTYVDEQEIFINDKILNIPDNSQLFFIDDENSNQRDLIKKYELDKTYRISFVKQEDVDRFRGKISKLREQRFQEERDSNLISLEEKKDKALETLLSEIKSKISEYYYTQAKVIADKEDYYKDYEGDETIYYEVQNVPEVQELISGALNEIDKLFKELFSNKKVSEINQYYFSDFEYRAKDRLSEYIRSVENDLGEKIYSYRNEYNDTINPNKLFWFVKDIYGYGDNPVKEIDKDSLAKRYVELMEGDMYRYYKESDLNLYKKGGKTKAQTPAPKKDQIKGSKKNKKGSSKDIKSAKSIKLSEKTLKAIKNKVNEHNEKHPKKKINVPSAKAVVRRGMGAYSSSHRPTIKGGKPNSRVAWGLARLNAFIYKIINGKSKSGKYSQDDDLIKELGYKVKKYSEGGDVGESKYQFRDIGGSIIYYKKENDGLWEFIKKDEFDKYANDSNIELYKKEEMKNVIVNINMYWGDIDARIDKIQIQAPKSSFDFNEWAEENDIDYEMWGDDELIDTSWGYEYSVPFDDYRDYLWNEKNESKGYMSKSLNSEYKYKSGGQTPAQQGVINRIPKSYNIELDYKIGQSFKVDVMGGTTTAYIKSFDFSVNEVDGKPKMNRDSYRIHYIVDGREQSSHYSYLNNLKQEKNEITLEVPYSLDGGIFFENSQYEDELKLLNGKVNGFKIHYYGDRSWNNKWFTYYVDINGKSHRIDSKDAYSSLDNYVSRVSNNTYFQKDLQKFTPPKGGKIQTKFDYEVGQKIKISIMGGYKESEIVGMEIQVNAEGKVIKNSRETKIKIKSQEGERPREYYYEDFEENIREKRFIINKTVNEIETDVKVNSSEQFIKINRYMDGSKLSIKDLWSYVLKIDYDGVKVGYTDSRQDTNFQIFTSIDDFKKQIISNDNFKKGGQTPAQQDKIAKVMGEFKRGELNTSYGEKVTDDKQAIAIALSEAGVNKKEEGGLMGLKNKIDSANPFPDFTKNERDMIMENYTEIPIKEDGGVIEGQLHTECNDNSGCGEKFDVGGVGNIIEAERDEAVIVSNTFKDQNKYTMKGTPSQIASALNVMGGGKNFDGGAIIDFNGKIIDTNKIRKETNDTDVENDIESGSVIINRRSMYDDTIYEVKGTPKQIASAINSVNGYGVVIENGATIKEA